MKIRIVDYNKNWENYFLYMKEKIKKMFNDIKIYHIGSTAVPGLMAKPIIDIMIGVKDDNFLNDTIEPFKKIGFQYISRYEKDIPNRRFFIFKDDSIKYHIHVVKQGTHWQKRHIVFRDQLKNNKEVMIRYQNLKIKLSKKEWKDTNEYADAKTGFIRSIEKMCNI